MDAPNEAALSEEVRHEVQRIMFGSVREQMRQLNRADLCAMLEFELRYLAGSNTDPDAYAIIHWVIEDNIDRWVMIYLNDPPNGSAALRAPLPLTLTVDQHTDFAALRGDVSQRPATTTTGVA